MRLYLNDKEARLIRLTLLTSQVLMAPEDKSRAQAVVDRIDICEKLQNSERRAKDAV